MHPYVSYSTAAIIGYMTCTHRSFHALISEEFLCMSYILSVTGDYYGILFVKR